MAYLVTRLVIQVKQHWARLVLGWVTVWETLGAKDSVGGVACLVAHNTLRQGVYHTLLPACTEG